MADEAYEDDEVCGEETYGERSDADEGQSGGQLLCNAGEQGAQPVESGGKKKKKRKKAPPVRINLSNCKYEILRIIQRKLGWKEVGDDEDWEIYWTDTSVSIERIMKLGKTQKINHFNGMLEICRKKSMARNLQKMQKMFPELYDFFPKTFVLPNDLQEMMADAKARGKKQVYILKPDAGCQGRGIRLVQGGKEEVMVKVLSEMATPNIVVQHYLPAPFLIHGYKFDLRIYALVLSSDPLRVFLFREGLARICTEKYVPPKASNLDVAFIHLTNYAVNKRNAEHFVAAQQESGDDAASKWCLAQLAEYIDGQGHSWQQVWSDIQQLIIKSLICVQPVLRNNYRSVLPPDNDGFSCFEILGYDIMLDTELRPWLIEVNHSPSFNIDSPLDLAIKEELITDTIELVRVDPRLIHKAKKAERKAAASRLLEPMQKKKGGPGAGPAGSQQQPQQDTASNSSCSAPPAAVNSGSAGAASGASVAATGGSAAAGAAASATSAGGEDEGASSTAGTNKKPAAAAAAVKPKTAEEYEALRAEVLRRREKYEAKHSGGFVRIYPTNDEAVQRLYDELLKGAADIFSSTFTSRTKKVIEQLSDEKRKKEEAETEQQRQEKAKAKALRDRLARQALERRQSKQAMAAGSARQGQGRVVAIAGIQPRGEVYGEAYELYAAAAAAAGGGAGYYPGQLCGGSRPSSARSTEAVTYYRLNTAGHLVEAAPSFRYGPAATAAAAAAGMHSARGVAGAPGLSQKLQQGPLHCFTSQYTQQGAMPPSPFLPQHSQHGDGAPGANAGMDSDLAAQHAGSSRGGVYGALSAGHAAAASPSRSAAATAAGAGTGGGHPWTPHPDGGSPRCQAGAREFGQAPSHISAGTALAASAAPAASPRPGTAPLGSLIGKLQPGGGGGGAGSGECMGPGRPAAAASTGLGDGAQWVGTGASGQSQAGHPGVVPHPAGTVAAVTAAGGSSSGGGGGMRRPSGTGTPLPTWAEAQSPVGGSGQQDYFGVAAGGYYVGNDPALWSSLQAAILTGGAARPLSATNHSSSPTGSRPQPSRHLSASPSPLAAGIEGHPFRPSTVGTAGCLMQQAMAAGGANGGLWGAGPSSNSNCGSASAATTTLGPGSTASAGASSSSSSAPAARLSRSMSTPPRGLYVTNAVSPPPPGIGPGAGPGCHPANTPLSGAATPQPWTAHSHHQHGQQQQQGPGAASRPMSAGSALNGKTRYSGAHHAAGAESDAGTPAMSDDEDGSAEDDDSDADSVMDQNGYVYRYSRANGATGGHTAASSSAAGGGGGAQRLHTGGAASSSGAGVRGACSPDTSQRYEGGGTARSASLRGGGSGGGGLLAGMVPLPAATGGFVIRPYAACAAGQAGSIGAKAPVRSAGAAGATYMAFKVPQPPSGAARQPQMVGPPTSPMRARQGAAVQAGGGGVTAGCDVQWQRKFLGLVSANKRALAVTGKKLRQGTDIQPAVAPAAQQQ